MKVSLFIACLVLQFISGFFVCASAQTRQYPFERIDMTDGLSHHMVNDILKDSSGFVWFATSSGLDRYDGYSMRVFKNIPGDTASLLADDVRRINEGPHGMIWLFTSAGNTVYDYRTQTFHRNTNAFLRKLSVAEGLITFIQKDRAGNFWFVHYNQGLFCYRPSTGVTTRLFPDEHDSTTISSVQISALSEDHDGNMWLVHQNGVFEKLDAKTLKVTYRNFELQKRFDSQSFEYNLMVDSDNDLWLFSDRNFGCYYFNSATAVIQPLKTTTTVKLNSNIVKKIIQDDEGKIWIGTEHGGINILNKKDFSVTYVLTDDEDKKSISENSIQSLYKDREGIIWVGTSKYGVSYYHRNMFRFRLHSHQASKPESLPFNAINAFAEDKKGNIWIGTDGGGLIRFNREKNSFRQYLHKPNDPNSLSNNVIVSLWVDEAGILWIGTYYGGLNKFDGKTFARYTHDPKDPKSLGDDNIWEIIEAADHNLWLGTLKGGVDVFDRKKGNFYHYVSGDPNSIHTNYVPALMEDNEGNMWIGTGYGLEVLDKSSGRFKHYLKDPDDPKSISNNGVVCLLQDSHHRVWIGTLGGLNLFDPADNTFRVFLEQDGLNHNTIMTLVEDDEGAIWMSTPKGLSQLSIKKDPRGLDQYNFKNYDESDGLMNGPFRENAALKCASGELIFGGSDGFNIFHPNQIVPDKTKPRVLLTDFQFFNKSVRIGAKVNGNIILPQAISHVNKVVVGPANNVFSIEFTALNFFHPEKTQYQYLMEGFTREWLTTDADQRKVTFTNLDPGDYLFKVKAANRDGVGADQPTVLKITVLPPLWKSNPAIVSYAILIVAALFVVRGLIVRRERMSFKVQQEKLEAQRMHALDEMKIKFFTNVSHEFRTPLTLILTPLENLIKNSLNADEKNHFQLIYRNARRLLNLVNQLLDFRKVEIQQIGLSNSEGDIITFMRELVYSFSDVSKQKNIALNFRSAFPSFETYFDQDKVEKILFNLLSNAFKFTISGKVEVEVSQAEQNSTNYIRIDVIDTGIGIPKDKQARVFDRFYQNPLPGSMVNEGNGIGLSIAQEFAKAHGGAIQVTSEVGKGSCFSLFLPLKRMDRIELQAAQNDRGPEEIILGEIEAGTARPTLLLVEDNDDFRFYLKEHLKKEYTVLEAANGKQGFQMAVNSIPDLIISDVMMPEIDGMELCKKLKGDKHTSHIPVILLTARHSPEQKIEGFEFGADDYITKPFNFEILQSRIKNLIQQRIIFQKHFQKYLSVQASEVHITSLDEKFIKNAIAGVESNLSNTDFSVEELSRMMGMSRVLLYRKLLSLTGKSPIEFIRTIRLQRAAQLLEKSQYTVAEVSYQVGFNNPKYFARYFRDEYHVLPSAYAGRKKLKNQDV
jgi:signal transduction histidine kinase/ligand-binding sensor domain-containing protein/DNA-binding response OmpR family regulator